MILIVSCYTYIPMHFQFLDVSGKILDLSMLAMGQGEKASTQAAVLAESEEKRLVTLIKIPNAIVDEGTCKPQHDSIHSIFEPANWPMHYMGLHH